MPSRQVNPGVTAIPYQGRRKRAVSASVPGAAHPILMAPVLEPSPFLESGLSVLIYVDESGDLGWSFDQPYGSGGSSRFLTIAALQLPASKEHLPERVVRNLYKHFGWRTDREKKWVDMPQVARSTFARAAVALTERHSDIRYTSIIVNKQRVAAHVRRDENKLYNYMLKLLLTEEMARHEHVTLLPDPRSIKVESGRSMHDYLQTVLWFDLGASTALETVPRDSAGCLNVQFADMLAGTVQAHFERRDSAPWTTLAAHINLKQLFF